MSRKGPGGWRNPCTINPLHGPVHAKAMCFSCYMKNKRGTLNVEKERAATVAPARSLPGLGTPIEDDSLLKDLPSTIAKKGMVAAAKWMIEKFIYHPKRVAVIMRHFYERSLKSDALLKEYVKILIPNQDTGSAVQVIINAPTITQKTEQVFDVTGEEIKSGPVDVQ